MCCLQLFLVFPFLPILTHIQDKNNTSALESDGRGADWLHPSPGVLPGHILGVVCAEQVLSSGVETRDPLFPGPLMSVCLESLAQPLLETFPQATLLLSSVQGEGEEPVWMSLAQISISIFSVGLGPAA